LPTEFAGDIEYSLQCVFSLSMRQNLVTRKYLTVLHGPHFVLFLWLSTRRTVEINGLGYETRLWALLAILGSRICIDIVQDDRNIGIMRFPSAGSGSRRLLCTCLEISFGGLLITRTWGSRYLCRQVCKRGFTDYLTAVNILFSPLIGLPD
jgi:hypothetical protein